jgi:hypothetical protein
VRRVVQPSARRTVWLAHATGAIERLTPAAEHAVPADRYAREIVPFLTLSYAARSRQLNGNPLGRSLSHNVISSDGTPTK